MRAATSKTPPGAFSPLIMIALVLVGIFAFAAFLTLSAFAPELTSGRDGRAHALSQSAVGYAGIVRLARARGDAVEIGRTIGDQSRFESLVVLTPDGAISPDDLRDAAGGSTLIVLPKWTVGPHPTRRGWVSTAGAYDVTALTLFLQEVAPDVVVSRTDGTSAPRLWDGEQFISAGPIMQLQTIEGPNVTSIVSDVNGKIVLGLVQPEGLPSFYVLSDPDFLNTQGVSNISTARTGLAMLDLVRIPDDPIVFDVTLNGLGAARSALRLIFEQPFLGATLALVVAAGLLGWRAASRFGPGAPPKRSIPLGKAMLADNSAALIRLAGRDKTMGYGYARLIASQLVESFGGGRKDEAESVAWLDQFAAAHNVAPSFSTLVAAASSAKSRNEMLEAARKLHAWKEEIKRATR